MNELSFNILLGQLMADQRCTVPNLAWRTGLAERSIQNWLAGTRPRHWQPIIKMADALNASETMTNRLLQAVKKPTVSQLKRRVTEPNEIGFLAAWQGVFSVPSLPKPFVGRDRLIAEIRHLLTDENGARICLLQGMAGVGKSVLAKKIAHSLADHFVDGVLWVELPEQASEQLHAVFYHLCTVCGIGSEMAMSLPLLQQRFHQWLAGRHVLLILDNVQSGQQIDQFYGANLTEDGLSAVALLMTGQPRTLTLPYETTVIQLMSFDFQHHETIQLFAQYLGHERVEAERDTFIEIADLIGHLPLAATIVARRLATDSSWSAADFLENDLRPEHSRLEVLEYDDLSVRLSFNLSYERLSSDKQRQFAELGVFGGRPFDEEAAASILNTSPRAIKRLLRELHQLALLETMPPSHYQLHPLLSQYAQDFLAGKDIYGRKISYYINYAQTHQHNPRSLYQEMGNIEQALRDASEQNLEKLFVQGVESTHFFLYDYNAYGDIPNYLEKALAIARSQQDHHHVASLLAGLAYINICHNHRETAATQLNEASDIAEQQNDINALIKIRKIQGGLLRGTAEQAQTMWDNALDLAIQANNPNEIVTLHYNLATLHWQQARLARAMSHIQAVQPFLPLVNARLQSFIYSVQGLVEWSQGELDAAESSYERALTLARPLNNPANLTIVFLRYGYLSRLQERYDKAQIFFEQGIHNAKLANRTADHIKLLSRYAEIMILQKRYEEAHQTLQTGVALSATINNPACDAQLHLERGRLEMNRSSKSRVAQPHLDASLAIANQSKNVELMMDAHLCLGEMYTMSGDVEEAIHAYERVEKIAADSQFLFYTQLAKKQIDQLTN